MLKIIDETKFIDHTFRNGTREYRIKGIKSGVSGDGVVLHLKADDGSEIHKSIKEMVIENTKRGNWEVSDYKEKEKVCEVKVKDCKEKDCKEGQAIKIEKYLDKCIYKNLEINLKEIDEEILSWNPTFEDKPDNYPTWLKPQAIENLSGDPTVKDARIQLQKWLREDKQTWEFKRTKREKDWPLPMDPERVRKGFLEYLYDAYRHAQSHIINNVPVSYAEYLMLAMERYWTRNIPELIKKCDRASTKCSITIGKVSLGKTYLIKNDTDDPGNAVITLYFDAPKYPYGKRDNYNAEIRIVAQSSQSGYDLVGQLKGSEKKFRERLNDVSHALSVYFKDHGMIVLPSGELAFKSIKELKKWLNNLMHPVSERAIQLLGYWVSRGGIDDCLNQKDAIEAKELLAQKFEEFANTSSVTKSDKLKKKQEPRSKLKGKRNYKPLIISIVAVLLLTFGYLGFHSKGVTPGSKKKFHISTGVFFRTTEYKGLRNTYLRIKDEDCKLFTQELHWLTPKGITILDKSVSAKSGNISWSERSSRITAEGVILTFRGTVRVEKDCPEGKHWIYVSVPAIQRLIKKYGKDTKAYYSYGNLRPKETISFKVSEFPAIPVAQFSVQNTTEKHKKAQKKAESERKLAEAKWSKWQNNLKSAYDEALKYDNSTYPIAKGKADVWQRIIDDFSDDNPYSTEDEVMRKHAMKKVKYWKNYKEPEPAIEKTFISLRSTFSNLSKDDVNMMLKNHNFYDRDRNNKGYYVNDYELKEINGDKIVIDHTTGLIWHQSGSTDFIKWVKVKKWVKKLNKSGYASYSDWRLPTTEEVASLLESSGKKGDLCIDPVFDRKQQWIWTGDKYDSDRTWFVSYYSGRVLWGTSYGFRYVRPVFSGKIPENTTEALPNRRIRKEYPDDMYIGEIRNGKRNGTYTWSNGNEYNGSWSNGVINGQGTMTYVSGDKYIGDWKDGKRDGYGTYTWSDGNEYEGNWSNGVMNGQGTMKYANGNKYVGNWKNGKKHGDGKFITSDGKEKPVEYNNGIKVVKLRKQTFL